MRKNNTVNISGGEKFRVERGTADPTRGCFTGGGALHSYFSPTLRIRRAGRSAPPLSSRRV